MLRVNVGLSRKLSKDYNSTGFSINLDGEISAPASDAEAVIEQVKELYDLAEEALDRQIERASADSAIGSHDEEAHQRPVSNGYARRQPPSNGNGRRPTNQNQNSNGHVTEAATNKQINYLLNIGKRQRLSTAQLEQRINDVLGHPVGVYDLSKRDAATVIDALTSSMADQGRDRVAY